MSTPSADDGSAVFFIIERDGVPDLIIGPAGLAEPGPEPEAEP